VIVTRQRRKPFPWRRLILPLLAIAAVVIAFAWGPSRNVIANGPLAPVWSIIGTASANIAKPFDLAAKDQIITDRNKTIVQLNGQMADLQSQLTAKSKQVADLNAQVQQLQAQAASSRGGTSPAPVASGAPAQSAQAAGPAATPAPATGTDAMRRTAQYWSNMEPENAAKLVQKLPVPYVADVMQYMSADDVGAILDALPPAFAAQLTQEHPELKR
jgi:flagellar motility protein MotE (MotC chaperone)